MYESAEMPIKGLFSSDANFSLPKYSDVSELTDFSTTPYL